ncbi:AMP-binding protein [Sideroxydans lithotrophicus]|uniref:AMP-dependent synthetase and ligase n=1 Tax=Sideroxydans lithotrophicus (strain ES-1) TaxID=580332 RepID=D5CLL8_SIDLE|nr:AMP-binding protein [Sideroxydans lithotrophicus]ADE10606.1 AMP-dependent synthetase and ligase [Sideroxydans lithotrophicus ES-1]
MSAIQLFSHDDPDRVFAYREGVPVSAAQFLQHAAQLAGALPDKRYILNLCSDRYRFAVGFAAALLRRQTSLLPPNYTPSFVERLGRRYPAMYCLADGEVDFQGVEVVHYPSMVARDDSMFAVPAIPTEHRAALVFTSGSTGEPVEHPKSWGSLCNGAVAEAAALGIVRDSGMAVLGTVPAQHMYGLESCMLIAMQNGLALVGERPFYPADIVAQLAALPQPRCLVTTPVHLRTLLSGATELPSVEFVLCATAHLAPQLASEAEARFAAPLYEIYGCTESGMAASRRTTQGAAWHLLPGVGMRQDRDGCRVSGGHVEIEAQLSDVIERNADGSFLLHGRTADMVNIAGKRTSLASLNHHLNSIAGVQDGVFLMPDDDDGTVTRPLAFVVAPQLSGEDILSALRNSVDVVFLPRPLYFVDELPRNSTGKLTRESLLRLQQQCAQRR